MKKNVKSLLINPPISGDLSSGLTTVKVPLGIAYIAAVLEKNNHGVKIIDAMADYENVVEIEENKYRIGKSIEDIKEEALEYKPDIIGIHCAYTAYADDAIELAKTLKKELPKCLIVFGGAHSSANPSAILNNDFVDLVVMGEGEYTFLDIVNRIKNNDFINNIKGTAVKVRERVRINEKRDMVKDIDEIPFPARHLLPMDKYFKHPENSLWTMRGPATDIITSRGCPGDCVFCSINTVWGRFWRGRSARNVVDEIEMLVKEYGVRQIRIQDDNISLNKKRLIDICDLIVERKLDIKWDTPNGIAIWTLDEEVLRKMKKSGYYRAAFGIESGSEKTLKFINKPINLEQVRVVINTCNKLGIWTSSSFIIGFPEEQYSDIKKTIDFAKESGLDFAIFYIAQPYMGTKLHTIFEEMNLMPEGFKETSSVMATKYNTKYFKAEDLLELQKFAYNGFLRYKLKKYINPFYFYSHFLSKIRGYEDLKSVVKLSKNMLNKNKTFAVFTKKGVARD